MKLKLIRNPAEAAGVFGLLETASGEFICRTLEHSYQVGLLQEYQPKLPNGTYRCIRGIHKIGKSLKEIETFEIINVPGHTGILFHCGNLLQDSSGCVLVGRSRINDALTESRVAFAQLMNKLSGLNEITLEVSGL